MNYSKILSQLPNIDSIIYLDSSSLIRSYPQSVISKKFTRTKYINNPQKFLNDLNFLINPLLDESISLCDILTKIIQISALNVITLDCLFRSSDNHRIYPLFGTFDIRNNVTCINNSTILYEDKISVETIYQASTLIRSAETIILDDYFISLPLCNQLLERRNENSNVIMLSSLINISNYKTEHLIDFFSVIYSFSKYIL